MIRIREAREEDVGQIREIFLAVYGADYPHHEVYDELWLKRSVFTDDALILVAEDTDAGRVVGTASVLFDFGAHSDLVGEFGRLAVHPDYRRGGVGRMLLQLVIGDANANRAESVSLEVQRENLGAQSLYRAHGFEECGVRRHYYGRGQDAVIMTRRFPVDPAATPAD